MTLWSNFQTKNHIQEERRKKIQPKKRSALLKFLKQVITIKSSKQRVTTMKKKLERANTYRNYWKFICDCFSCTMTRIWMWCHFLCLARPEKWWNDNERQQRRRRRQILCVFFFERFRPQSLFSCYRFSSSLFFY